MPTLHQVESALAHGCPPAGVGWDVGLSAGQVTLPILLATGIEALQCWGRVEREPKEALGGRRHVTWCKRSLNHPQDGFSTCTRVLAEWLCSRKMYISVQQAPPHQYRYLPFSPVLTCCLPHTALLSAGDPTPLHNNASAGTKLLRERLGSGSTAFREGLGE